MNHKNFIENLNFQQHLNAYWIRPESGFWDSIAASHIGPLLKGKSNIVEIGIGNGFFSFLMLGGKFHSDFDWFYSVNTKDYWSNTDIFNHDSGIDIGKFILQSPHTQIEIGVDHKRHLLNQAARLGLVKTLVEHDCNNPIHLPITTKIIYSNILYWLNDPISTLKNLGEGLQPGGELIIVFPNKDFFRICTSYSNNNSISKLLNRGRANHMMWSMNLCEFEKHVNEANVFEIISSCRYLAPSTLRIWDIGLRPLASPLIKMANSLDSKLRLEIKAEWCETLEKFFLPLLELELRDGSSLGGFNLVHLHKK